jgi:hypothetical protein
VEHPRWKIWNATEFELKADIATLYGEQFAETLSQSPRSGFIADGSPITIAHRSIDPSVAAAFATAEITLWIAIA